MAPNFAKIFKKYSAGLNLIPGLREYLKAIKLEGQVCYWFMVMNRQIQACWPTGNKFAETKAMLE